MPKNDRLDGAPRRLQETCFWRARWSYPIVYEKGFRLKHIRGECQHCSGHFEFPAESIGLQAPCPHCGQQTELMLQRPPEEPSLPRRVVAWTVAAIIVLALGLAGAMFALKRAERWAAKRKNLVEAGSTVQTTNTSPEPAAANANPEQNAGFDVSSISLEKAAGTSLVYVVGTVKNKANKQRFGLKLELDLLDAGGKKMGTAKDYQAVLEPGAEWRFKALVVDPKGVVAAKVASLKEEQ